MKEIPIISLSHSTRISWWILHEFSVGTESPYLCVADQGIYMRYVMIIYITAWWLVWSLRNLSSINTDSQYRAQHSKRVQFTLSLQTIFMCKEPVHTQFNMLIYRLCWISGYRDDIWDNSGPMEEVSWKKINWWRIKSEFVVWYFSDFASSGFRI